MYLAHYHFVFEKVYFIDLDITALFLITIIHTFWHFKIRNIYQDIILIFKNHTKVKIDRKVVFSSEATL